MLLTTEEIENILKKVLPAVSLADIRRAAAAITETSGKWREVSLTENLGANLSVQCQDICAIGEAYAKKCKIRAFIEG